MQADTINYEKGETPMTDYQFRQYEAIRDKCEDLSRENIQLREEISKLKSENEQLKKG